MRFGYGQRGGHGMRWIIALVLAAVAGITYLTRTQVNPVTGERQRVSLSPEQEVQLGRNAAPQMAQQMGGVLDPSRETDARLVAEVGQRIVDNSDARKHPDFANHFRFHLLADPRTVNAFALPGGQIFITRALFDQLENEAQLAGVLGHEIGHVINRHSAEHMAKSQLGQSLAMAAGVGAGSYDAARMAQMVNQMIQLRYSRQDELESDNYGLAYMRQAGYDPSAMIRVMEILKKASGGGGRGPDVLATHPDPDARIQYIKEYLQKEFPNGVPENLRRGRPLRGERLIER